MESQRTAGVFGDALYAVKNSSMFRIVFVTAEGTVESIGNEENISFGMQYEMGWSAACVCGESLVHCEAGFVDCEDTELVAASVGGEDAAPGRIKESHAGMGGELM
jgi:hypothetical protein